MRTYNLIIGDIQTLLNKKNYGRGKKGFNLQEEFLSLLSELKNSFGIELSTQFLFNLFNNEEFNLKQKRQKIRNLLRDLKLKKEYRYLRDLEVLNYRTDIINYKYKKGYTPSTEQHKNRKVKTPQIKISNKGYPYIDLFRQDKIRDIGKFIKEDKGIYFNIRNQLVSKEFLTTKRQAFKFIELEGI